MNTDILHALTLHTVNQTIVAPPPNIDKILGNYPTKTELQNSIQYLNNKGLLIKTDQGWFPSDLAKSLFHEAPLGSDPNNSLLILASKLRNI